jgi:hypothetical protein
MGTRGAMGVRIDGVDKICYNHYDSYPESLGESVVADIRQLLVDPGLDGFKMLARELRLVDGESKPTPEDKATFAPFSDRSVASKSDDDWYCLLRRYQGRLAATLLSRVMIDSLSFMADSLFCEYAYVANLDSGKLELYRGFQRSPHELGRFASMQRRDEYNEYWPVALVKEFDLTDIPQDWAAIAFPKEEE